MEEKTKLPEKYCSGFRIFPNGEGCNGCPDCRKDIDWDYPELTTDEKERHERVEAQIDEWVKGNPVHNTIDNECCPDFSCCTPETLQPKEVRETFKRANLEQRESFLFTFLGAAIDNHYKKKGQIPSVFIANGKDEINSEFN